MFPFNLAQGHGRNCVLINRRGVVIGVQDRDDVADANRFCQVTHGAHFYRSNRRCYAGKTGHDSNSSRGLLLQNCWDEVQRTFLGKHKIKQYCIEGVSRHGWQDGFQAVDCINLVALGLQPL